MRQDLLRIKDKVSGLAMERKIVRKAHGKFTFTSPLMYTKAKVGAAAAKRTFPGSNKSKIDDIRPVKRAAQAHPGNSNHLNIDAKKFCTYCNCHIAKGSFGQHVDTGKHQNAVKANVQYEYCSVCSIGHIIGTSCPKLPSQDGSA